MRELERRCHNHRSLCKHDALNNHAKLDGFCFPILVIGDAVKTNCGFVFR